MNEKNPQAIRCRDGCGRSVADESEAQAKAWECLQITGRYRCPSCMRELAEANKLTDGQIDGMDSTMLPLGGVGNA